MMDADVKVWLADDGNGGTEWWMMHADTGAQGGPGNYPEIEFPSKSGPHNLKFEIEYEGCKKKCDDFEKPPVTPESVVFATNEQAIGITSSGTKPTSAGNQVPEQISDISTTAGDSVLRLKDKNDNEEPMDMQYSLFFTGAPSLDPVIRNGGEPPFDDVAAPNIGLLLLVGLVAVLVGAFVGYSMGKKKTS